MPARTNEFQRMIFAIQSHISDGAVVTESKFLIDRDTQNPVEIDVVVEDVVGGFPIVVGIECVDRKRPATIEWLREMIAKHQGLPISKTVLVSKSGFTKEAALKAKKNNIEILTPKQAEVFPWSSLFKKIENSNAVGFEFYLKKLSIKFHGSIENRNIKLTSESKVSIESNLIPLPQLAMEAAEALGILRKILEDFHGIPKSKDHFDFSFIINNDAYLFDDNCIKVRIREISASIGFKFKSQGLKFSSINFNNQVFATSPLDGSLLGIGLTENSIATISGRNDGATKITIIDSNNKKIEMNVVEKIKMDDSQWLKIDNPLETASR